MEPEISLSQLLLQTRKLQGISREALAGLAQVSTTFIRDAEKDANNCSYGKLTRLMTALGIKWLVPTNRSLQVLQLRDDLTNEENELVKRFAQSLLDQRKTFGAKP